MSSLYEFMVGTTPHRYTSSDTDVTYDSNTYTAIAIERSEIFLDFLQDTLTIKMQADQQPASNFKNDIHVERIELTVRSLKTSSAETLFKGYVLKGTYDLKQDLITFNCKRFPEGESSLNRVFGTSCGFGWGEAFRQDLFGTLPSGSGTFTASSGSGSASGTNFSLLSAGDYIWVKEAVYKCLTVDSSSNTLTMSPNAKSTYSAVNWWKVTDLTGCPVNREEYKRTLTNISSLGFSFTTGSYGAIDTLSGPSSDDLFADDANDVDASGTAIKKFLFGNVTFKDSSGNIIGVNRIVKVTSSTVTFQKPLTNSSDVHTIIAYQGCTKRFSTCKNKFNANPFFGGFPYLRRVDSRSLSLEGPLPTQNRVVPEIIGTMWTKPTVFYISPAMKKSSNILLSATARQKKVFGIPIGPEGYDIHKFNLDNSYYSSTAEAICVKNDFLLGLKLFGEKVKIGETRTRSKSGSAHVPELEGMIEADLISDGDFPPIQDSERFYYNIADFEEKSPAKSTAKGIGSPPEAVTSNIKQDPADASSEMTSGIPMFNKVSGENPLYMPSVQLRQYMEFYSGENRLTTPIIDDLEESFAQEEKGMKYVGFSYIVFGPTVFPSQIDILNPTRTIMTALSKQAYIGSHQYAESEPELSQKAKREFDPDHEVKVYHAPTINATASANDFGFALRTGDTAFSNYTTLTSNISTGDPSVTVANSAVSGEYYVRSDQNKITHSGGSASLLTQLKVGDYILFEPTLPQSGTISETPRRITNIVSNSVAYYEGANLARPNKTFGTIYRTAAFFTRPDFNSGDAVKVGNEFYIIDKIQSETQFFVEPNIRETVSSATIAIADYVGANPANVLYYILNSILNIPTTDIDITSFTDARDQLNTDEVGVNVKIDTLSTLRSEVNAILDLINGVLHWDTTAGKFKLGLMRDTNYGSQTINSVKKTYSSANSSNFTVETTSYDDLYTHVSIEYSNPYNDDQDQVLFDQCNETTSNVLGYTRYKSLSNKFVTNSNLAQFYMNLKFNQYTQIQNKVKLRIPIDDLNLLHQGCLISYTDTAYSLNFIKIRVDKISGFNEFASYLTVEGHVEYSINDYSVFAPELEEGEATISELSSLEIAPCGIDPLGYFQYSPEPHKIFHNNPAYVLPVYKSKSLTQGANVEYLDSSDVPMNQGLISRPALKGHLDTEYDPTGFIDKSSTGISVSIPAGTDNLFAVDSDNFSYYALISTRVETTTTNEVTIENSDYEMIAFKKLVIDTAPTETTDGAITITNICRNITNQNYYAEDPFSSNSKYEDGKTNITGQFQHSVGANVYIFLSNEYGEFQRREVTADYIANNFAFNIKASGRTVSGSLSGTSIQTDEYSYATPRASGSTFITAPYRWKLYFPPPPATVYGYTTVHGSERYFTLYISPANDRSGASWRSPNSTPAGVPADKRILIEFVDSDGNGNTRIQIYPDQSFTTEYVTKGELDSSSSDGDYVSGHLFPSEAKGGQNSGVTTGKALFNLQGSNHISSFNTGDTDPQGGDIFTLRDVIVNKEVINHAVFMYKSPSNSIDFYVSQVRPDLLNVKSTRRKITLTNTTTTLQIV